MSKTKTLRETRVERGFPDEGTVPIKGYCPKCKRVNGLDADYNYRYECSTCGTQLQAEIPKWRRIYGWVRGGSMIAPVLLAPILAICGIIVEMGQQTLINYMIFFLSIPVVWFASEWVLRRLYLLIDRVEQ